MFAAMERITTRTWTVIQIAIEGVVCDVSRLPNNNRLHLTIPILQKWNVMNTLYILCPSLTNTAFAVFWSVVLYFYIIEKCPFPWQNYYGWRSHECCQASSSEQCGVITSSARIIGGQTTNIRYWPWMVSGRNKRKSHFLSQAKSIATTHHWFNLYNRFDRTFAIKL